MKIGEFEIELAKGITVFVESNSPVKSTIIENLRKIVNQIAPIATIDISLYVTAIELKKEIIELMQDDAMLQIADLFIDHSFPVDLCIKTKQGENILFNQLNDGYKKILSIILHIAHSAKMHKIVILDDLNLHPMSLKTVLSRLHNTFPNVQFVVSTLSPILLSHLDTSVDKDGVQKNKAYLLQADGSAPILLPNLYGVDYNAVLRDFMGTPDRCQDIKDLKDEFFSYKEMGMENEASTIYDKIKGIVGENGAILKELK